RLVPDRLPALRLLPAAAVLDRGPGDLGALRRGLLDRGRRVRAAELPLRADGPVGGPPARAHHDWRQHAPFDVLHVPGVARGYGLPVRDAVQVRAGREERPDAGAPAAPLAARGRGLGSGPAPLGGAHLMPALPLDEAGKYVAAAYVVFLSLILI